MTGRDRTAGPIERAVQSRRTVRNCLSQKFAGIALLDQIADLSVGPGCFRREVQKGCDSMDCFGWSEGDPGGQAWPCAQISATRSASEPNTSSSGARSWIVLVWADIGLTSRHKPRPPGDPRLPVAQLGTSRTDTTDPRFVEQFVMAPMTTITQAQPQVFGDGRLADPRMLAHANIDQTRRLHSVGRLAGKLKAEEPPVSAGHAGERYPAAKRSRVAWPARTRRLRSPIW